MKSIKEVSDIFSVSERTVKRWIKSEELKVIKIGGTVRVLDEEIERIKSGNKNFDKNE